MIILGHQEAAELESALYQPPAKIYGLLGELLVDQPESRSSCRLVSSGRSDVTIEEARALVERAEQQYTQVCRETEPERLRLKADPRYRSPAIGRWLSAARAVLSAKQMLEDIERGV